MYIGCIVNGNHHSLLQCAISAKQKQKKNKTPPQHSLSSDLLSWFFLPSLLSHKSKPIIILVQMLSLQASILANILTSVPPSLLHSLYKAIKQTTLFIF
uniref:Uncharacterized protein n=1 Tax=Accipiter nisus TaxID=211598 RepID=A0A8B9ND64_9AVES